MSIIEQAYRHITLLDGVRSGRAVVTGTRLAVHDVIGLILNGAGVDDVVKSFPTLTRAQVYECLSYYEENQAEIDCAVARQMAEAEV